MLYDVVVIGGGPGRRDGGPVLGPRSLPCADSRKGRFRRQITITNEVVNYPGVGRTTGRALTQTMRQQAQDFGAEFLSAEATGLDVDGDIKTVHTSRGDLKAFGILIATGASPRKLGFEGEAEYAGRGVAYCATCDGEFFTRKEVLVVGGGFAAAEESVFLTKYASKVTVLVREPDFTCDAAVPPKPRTIRRSTCATTWSSRASPRARAVCARRPFLTVPRARPKLGSPPTTAHSACSCSPDMCRPPSSCAAWLSSTITAT